MPRSDVSKLEHARELMARAVKEQPDIASYRDTLGWIHYLRQDFVQAQREIRKAIRQMSDSPEVHYHLGRVQMALKDMELARWHFEAAKAVPVTDTTPYAEREAIRKAEDALRQLTDQQL